MKISVVTANYNYGRFLAKAIASVQTQVMDGADDLAVEHIVVDGASTDGSVDLLCAHGDASAKLPADAAARYAFRWVSEPDMGQTDAINKGLRMATGDVVCWLNADEYYMAGALRKVAAAFAAHPDTDFVYGEPLYVDAASKPLRIKRDHAFSGFVLLWYGCYIASCCSFWRRRVLDAGVYLDDSYRVVMDGEYWVRIMKKGYRFRFIPVTVAAFIWHDSNVSSVHDGLRIEEQHRIKLAYAPYMPRPGRMREVFISAMNCAAHQWRRILVLWRLAFMPRGSVDMAAQLGSETSDGGKQ